VLRTSTVTVENVFVYWATTAKQRKSPASAVSCVSFFFAKHFLIFLSMADAFCSTSQCPENSSCDLRDGHCRCNVGFRLDFELNTCVDETCTAADGNVYLYFVRLLLTFLHHDVGLSESEEKEETSAASVFETCTQIMAMPLTSNLLPRFVRLAIFLDFRSHVFLVLRLFLRKLK
jgi:hypothetical protein